MRLINQIKPDANRPLNLGNCVSLVDSDEIRFCGVLRGQEPDWNGIKRN